ncbi:hypothetical protein F5Y16DRAFT_403707 [Xylariaceae sp. FL0255]|nr:hypothetical protein F5Y16DRAFT_403707 [Xylariaceae sp. FL0255]
MYRPPGPHYIPALREWNEDFLKEIPHGLGHEVDSFAESFIGEPILNLDADIISPFLASADDTQSERIRMFCSNSKTLRSLTQPSTLVQSQGHPHSLGSPYKRIAFITNGDKAGRVHKTTNVHTAEGLYNALSPPRFSARKAQANLEEGQSNTTTDMDRRCIYIRDLDPSIICALAATASKLQIPVLQRLITGHLESISSIAVTISDIPTPYFSMEFHLPYYVLVKPPRKPSDERGLRSVEDLYFSESNSQYLCEAEISGSLSGYNERVWTLHCFIDSYYEDQVGTGEEQHEDEYPERFLAKSQTLTPREYFLILLNYHIRYIRHRWTEVLNGIIPKLEKKVDEMNMSMCNITTRSHNMYSKPDSAFWDKLRKKLFEWDCQYLRERLAWSDRAKVLLQKIIQRLENLISAYEEFAGGDIDYFLDYEPAGTDSHSRRSSIIALQREFQLVRKQLELLRFSRKQVDAIAERLKQQLANCQDTNHIQIRDRLETKADGIKRLTWSMHFFGSFQVAAVILERLGGTMVKRDIIFFLLTLVVIILMYVGIKVTEILEQSDRPWFAKPGVEQVLVEQLRESTSVIGRYALKLKNKLSVLNTPQRATTLNLAGNFGYLRRLSHNSNLTLGQAVILLMYPAIFGNLIVALAMFTSIRIPIILLVSFMACIGTASVLGSRPHLIQKIMRKWKSQWEACPVETCPCHVEEHLFLFPDAWHRHMTAEHGPGILDRADLTELTAISTSNAGTKVPNAPCEPQQEGEPHNPANTATIQSQPRSPENRSDESQALDSLDLCVPDHRKGVLHQWKTLEFQRTWTDEDFYKELAIAYYPDKIDIRTPIRSWLSFTHLSRIRLTKFHLIHDHSTNTRKAMCFQDDVTTSQPGHILTYDVSQRLLAECVKQAQMQQISPTESLRTRRSSDDIFVAHMKGLTRDKHPIPTPGYQGWALEFVHSFNVPKLRLQFLIALAIWSVAGLASGMALGSVDSGFMVLGTGLSISQLVVAFLVFVVPPPRM